MLAHQEYVYDISVLQSTTRTTYSSNRTPNEQRPDFGHTVTEHGTPQSVLDTQAAIAAYRIRKDFTISNKGADFTAPIWEPTAQANEFKVSARGELEDHDPVAMFPTLGECANFRTAYLQFVGDEVREFEEYGKTGSNVMSGLARLLKARPGEEQLRWNALNFGAVAVDVAQGRLDQMVATDERIQTYVDILMGDRRRGPVPDGIEGLEQIRPGNLIGMQRFVAERALDALNSVSRNMVQQVADTVMTVTSWAYYKCLTEALTLLEPILAREYCADIPHVKRALRRSYVQGVAINSTESNMVRRLDACVKRELAKPGKAARLFVSYGAGCMYANELPEFVKVCLDGPRTFSVGDLTCTVHIMAKPRSGQLDELFAKMYAALDIDDYMYCLIYSDDQVYGGRRGGVPFLYNVDIASNDSSQDIPAFLMTALSLDNFSPEQAKGLISQCMMPINVQNPSNREESFDLNFQGPFEGSGSVLTTILNHWGSYLGACGTAFQLANTLLPFEECVVRGHAGIGHSVTCESCTGGVGVVFEKMQFLKRSPLLTTDGVWSATMNYGTIFRGLGTTWDNLDAVKLGCTISEFKVMGNNQRMERMVSQVIGGLVHEPSTPIMDILRARFCSATGDSEATSSFSLAFGSEVLATSSCGARVDMQSFHRRYGTADHQIQELVTLLGSVNSGSTISLPIFDAFYGIDYGAT